MRWSSQLVSFQIILSTLATLCCCADIFVQLKIQSFNWTIHDFRSSLAASLLVAYDRLLIVYVQNSTLPVVLELRVLDLAQPPSAMNIFINLRSQLGNSSSSIRTANITNHLQSDFIIGAFSTFNKESSRDTLFTTTVYVTVGAVIVSLALVGLRDNAARICAWIRDPCRRSKRGDDPVELPRDPSDQSFASRRDSARRSRLRQRALSARHAKIQPINVKRSRSQGILRNKKATKDVT
eukprot:240844_1